MNDTERAGVNELVNKLNIKEERIVDLEKENAKLEGKLADLTSEYYELENLKNNEIAELKAYNEKLLDGDIEKHNKIVELKAQIEKMKCCGNCEHFNFSEPNYCHKGVYRERQYVCSEWKFGN